MFCYWKCKSFQLKMEVVLFLNYKTENVECLNNQELNWTFNLNDTIEPEYF